MKSFNDDNDYDYNDGFLVKDEDVEDVEDNENRLESLYQDYENSGNDEDFVLEEDDEDFVLEEIEEDDEDLVFVIKSNSSNDLNKFLKDVPDEFHDEIKNFKGLMERCSNKENYLETFYGMERDDKDRCIEFLDNLKDNNKSLIIKLLLSKIPTETKINVWNTIKPEIENSNNSGKYTVYLNSLLQLPFGKYAPNIFYNMKTPKKFINSARKTLDEFIFGHEEAKHYVIKYLSNAISNENIGGEVLSFVGFPGIGKTTFVENIAKILKRPFARICLGGYGDVSSLEGHNYTYEGSRPGKIVSILQSCGVMNPIISLDELDKVAKEEVINLLIHLLDPIQNKHFQDKYFGDVDIDLSKVTWVLTYNDSNIFSRILRDRIKEIKLDGFTHSEKIIITTNFIIPSFNSKYRFNVNIADNVIEKLIDLYTNETGVRKIKEIIDDIFKEINYQLVNGVIKRKKTINVNMKNYIKFFKFKKPMIQEKIHKDNTVGKINGLYASSSNGIGGIIPIEADWYPCDTILQLVKTGNLGKIMKESGDVAKTVAWNYITDKLKLSLRKKWEKNKEGIHLHCSEASIEKEGPSAGLATTIAIISLFTNRCIKSNVGVTGEINLSGNVLPIGGLREKFFGAKKAGCKFAIFPYDNMKDYEKIAEKHKELFDNFKVKPVKNIEDAVNFILLKK